MFKTLETLDTKLHSGLTYKGLSGYAHACALVNAPLSVAEVAEASKHFPILFPIEGKLLPVALLSLENDKSSFVSKDGQWLADYIPAHVRRYPFVLGNTGEEGRFVVMIDRAAPQFSDSEGEPIFVDGKPVEGGIVENARNFLVEFQKLLELTEKLLQPLEEKNVLVTRQFNIQRGKDEKVAVQGFRQVDEVALGKLDDATLAAWVRSGLMAVVVAHLHSLSNAQRILKVQQKTQAT
jgi:hypothetical protein